MLSSLRSKFAMLSLATILATASALVPAPAFALAAGLTTAQTQVLTYTAAATAFIVAVGGAVLLVVMVAKAVKWARKAG